MAPDPSLLGRLKTQPLLWLSLACAASLAPFVAKAYHMDDTLFLLAARHIRQAPLDFYAFPANWYGTAMPTWQIMQNPPLACYYQALVSLFFGWSEPAMHLGFMLPAAGAVCGTFVLAQPLCRQPGLAALACLLTPAFIVSATTVMCDVVALFFWTWAIAVWDRGLRGERGGFLCLAGALCAAAALSKYIGMALVPLLAVYTVAYDRSRGRPAAAVVAHLSALAIPVGALAIYQSVTATLYGRGLLFQAVEYAATSRGAAEDLLPRTLTSLAFLGGAAASILFFLPMLWPRRVLLAGAIAAVALMLACAGPLAPGLRLGHAQGTPWLKLGQFALLTGGGCALLALAALELTAWRDPAALLLALWVIGIYSFATFVNWTINVRALLPLLPAAGILLVRRLDRRSVAARNHAWLLAPAGVLALLVGFADYAFAQSVRATAAEIVARCREHPGTTYYQGHLGFQWYMERAGLTQLDHRAPQAQAGDLVVFPGNNSNVDIGMPPGPWVKPFFYEAHVVPCAWLTTMDVLAGAGFYDSQCGALPFVFGPVPPTPYFGLELATPAR